MPSNPDVDNCEYEGVLGTLGGIIGSIQANEVVKEILDIGDSIHHDIKGALLYGVDSLLITSGIHKSSFDKHNPRWDTDINELIKYKILPTYFSSKFLQKNIWWLK